MTDLETIELAARRVYDECHYTVPANQVMKRFAEELAKIMRERRNAQPNQT